MIAMSLANQLSSPFSYIALGVGPKPLVKPIPIEGTAAALTSYWDASNSNQTVDDGVWLFEVDTGLVKKGDGVTAYASLPYVAGGIQWESEVLKTKTKLDFEAVRIPVSAASAVEEGGKAVIALSGQLPAAQRFEFSEIGVFSAEKNGLLTTEPPRMIYTFSSTENWKWHEGLSLNDIRMVSSISSNDVDISLINPATGNPEPLFVSASNSVFFVQGRKNQRARVYLDALMVPGNLSTINTASAEWTATNQNHLFCSAARFSLSKARPDDVLSLAFSVANNEWQNVSTNPPVSVQIMIKMLDADNAGEYAKLQIDLENGVANPQITPDPSTTLIEDNGYFVAQVPISDLATSAGWVGSKIDDVEVYVQVEPDVGLAAEDYCVIVDALRFDSNNDNNPTYGLTAYSVVQNTFGEAEIKESGAESMVEFKVVLGE